MIDSIMEAISISLHAEFGDGYAIYTESVEQGLKEPCFFVFRLRSARSVFRGKRYSCDNPFVIQYFPADKTRIREECEDVKERLFSCLELLPFDGGLIRGVQKSGEVIDEVLNFFISYPLFVDRVEDTDSMTEISKNVYIKE